VTRAAVLALALALALGSAVPGTALADPNPQLVASVQQRLNVLGFTGVDARTLSTRQVAALHMELRGGAFSFGRNYIRARQRVETILGWDAPAADQ
jgi:hypothetical protein